MGLVQIRRPCYSVILLKNNRITMRLKSGASYVTDAA